MPASDIIKYLHEEPTTLVSETPDTDRPTEGAEASTPSVPLDALLNPQQEEEENVHRGYLAGTNLADTRFGLTTLRSPTAYVQPVLEAFGRSWWARCTPDGTVTTIDAADARKTLRAPSDTSVLVTADGPVDEERIAAVAGRDRRRTPPTLPALLEAAHVVCFPEPARDGADWRFFSASPMRDRLVAAFRAHPAENVRRFLLPYEHVRSESKFYFETWTLTDGSLPDYVEEV